MWWVRCNTTVQLCVDLIDGVVEGIEIKVRAIRAIDERLELRIADARLGLPDTKNGATRIDGIETVVEEAHLFLLLFRSR